MKDHNTVKAIFRNIGDPHGAVTTACRNGFYEFLRFIQKKTPTKQQVIDSVDMTFKHPFTHNWIHEDIICVRDYLEKYEGKLFEVVMNRLSLTQQGNLLLKALKS